MRLSGGQDEPSPSLGSLPRALCGALRKRKASKGERAADTATRGTAYMIRLAREVIAADAGVAPARSSMPLHVHSAIPNPPGEIGIVPTKSAGGIPAATIRGVAKAAKTKATATP